MRIPPTAGTGFRIPPWLAVGTLVLLALLLPRFLQAVPVDAQARWPTPPPGPQFSVPTEAQVNEPITGSVDLVGSEVRIVPPSWPGPLPLLPPIPSTALRFEDGVGDVPPIEIVVDAGTFATVAQVRLSPVNITDLPSTGHRVVWAFEIDVFDARGNEVRTPPQRPLELSILAGDRGSTLFFGVVAEEQLLATASSFDWRTQRIRVRLLEVGVVAVLEDVR